MCDPGEGGEIVRPHAEADKERVEEPSEFAFVFECDIKDECGAHDDSKNDAIHAHFLAIANKNRGEAERKS